ncbi:two-component sensor histidine kinase, partial [Myxococcus llanfairpwllgwyngyllgogerychwyrndrobwllllantysiliogogogochensis]
LALRTAGPIALLAPLLALAVWWAVSGSLAPVERVRRQLAKRQADDLSPVNAGALPDEVRPMVDELNLLFERVRQAFEAQQHFVADAAHELRSPLTRIRMGLELMQGSTPSPAFRSEILRNIAELDQLVDEILLASRLDAREADVGTVESIELLGLAAEEVA